MKRKAILIIGVVFFMLFLNVNSAVGYSEGLINENEQVYKNEEGQPIENMEPDWYHKPANYAELVSWYDELESDYPQYLELFKANDLYDTGTVTGGYDLYYLRITNENLGLDKPEVLFLGGPHGDETVGTIGMYWFTDWLFRMTFEGETNDEFSSDYLEWILDNREIYFEVSHNPYGFDHGPQRYDGNSWDLNREADYDGPGSPTGGIWASVNGKTLREFIDDHQIRVGCDIHGGVRMLIYPWADTFPGVSGTSPITGETYSHAPPDFYFYDASLLRAGAFMGDYGGDFNKGNTGPIRDLLSYTIKGGIAPWAYAADVETNPLQDPYVQDETFGNYPGAGILWVSPEMSVTKNPSENTFGNDTVHRFGAEIRRYILHQTDLAQPYIQWQSGTVEHLSEVKPETDITFKWMVNGSLVVDHTYIQWGTNPDPINNPEYTTEDYDEFAGQYIGGTGWENAESGTINGTTYVENIKLSSPGVYYFVAKAQVDQVYADVLAPETYGDTSYLRLIKERTDDDYHEVMNGNDGSQTINGNTWWYSPVIQVYVLNNAPERPSRPTGPYEGKPDEEYTFSTKASDPDGDQVLYQWDWGDGSYSEWLGPFDSNKEVSASHAWPVTGNFEITVKAKDVYGEESDWSNSLSINIPRYRAHRRLMLLSFLDNFPIIAHLIYYIKDITNNRFSL
jgi:hypothetical protein